MIVALVVVAIIASGLPATQGRVLFFLLSAGMVHSSS